MSALDLTLTGGERRRPGVLGVVSDRLGAFGAVVPAFVLSRLLVAAAGAAGLTRLHQRWPQAMTAQWRHLLGPVGYLTGAPAIRWDATYYLDIANAGYGHGTSGKLAFYPLYPLLMRVLSVVVGSPVFAGMAISAAAFLAALVAVHRLTELELGRAAGDATVLLLCFAPLSFFFSAVYTESLFLALSVGSVLAARTGRWRLACLLGALATVTRVTGIALGLALAIMRIRERGIRDRGLAWLLALPAAFALYMVYLAATGHSPLAMFSVESAWRREMVGPVIGAAFGLVAGLAGATWIAGGSPIAPPHSSQLLAPGAENVVLMAVLVAAAVGLIACRRWLRAEYTVFAAVTLAIVVSSPQIHGSPLISLDRYALTIFPLWMVAGAWLARRPRALAATIVGCAALLAIYGAEFASGAFIA
jgi:hypothetical protein